MKSELFVEFNGNKTADKTLIEVAKKEWVNEGKLVKDIKTITLYFKPDERTCYYVINNDFKGNFQI
ncbi:MAG: DUF6465 family protein [Clostridiales bacterium]|jgi:hypothetical protein|nr:DUF6465 family protein [Clostridiales bacterium]